MKKYIKMIFLTLIISSVILPSSELKVYKKTIDKSLLDRDFNDLNGNNFWDPGENLIFDDSKYRYVTVGGSITEIIFNLGLGSLVVAVDQSSTFPENVKNLPQVGYHRFISSEGVLSMMPNKIFATTDMGPPKAVSEIKNSGVDIEIYKAPKKIEDVINIVSLISNAMDMEVYGDIINNQILDLRDNIKAKSSNYKKTPKMAFFMNPSIGSYNAAGSGTAADYLIELIGGKNVFANDFNRYKKVDKEQILNYNPDIILVASHSGSEKASLHFLKANEFKFLTCVNNSNVIDISMSDLTMGPSFISNALLIMEKFKIDYKEK
ncbi:MAG: hypothetical protein CBC84_000930 [Pelagibacteraceae bacterium TMED124]|nr:hypothetical protein [Candidatus Neomarinimicrobiota bacterium]RPG19120.1 MAG: hypothetical protein CBC84_000930 [Pelagibacteraceae bacterium TMED124]|tara:strand:+ start:20077 stop:21039 length:963 start_codon:yes stop_codon:yes gene_type:complete